MLKKLKGFIREEEGQGLTEYALILGGIAVVVVAVTALLGTEIKELIESVFAKF